MEEKKEKRSVIVIAGTIGAILFSLIAAFSGNPEFLAGVVIFISIIFLEKYFITPYDVREKLSVFINNHQKPINYISFSMFLFLIIMIIVFRFK
ncbi:hypothetical protein [Marinicella litoralis]|uniref:Uncharacterized protein n=1 Tax=Marinicella litoralis TaxID=644220 RepID=A0A4R6XQI1_9GAMM|nr:hypothetical protein [Marinicella litoralis]TDR20470.1 hypothetical protein C8D91_1443 [Marinicella litoralis]